MKTAAGIIVVALALVLGAILAVDGVISGQTWMNIATPAATAAIVFLFEEKRVDGLQRELRRRDNDQR